MKILDLDMDYFMDDVANFNADSSTERLPKDYDKNVWSEVHVRQFLENNLGLSTNDKKRGRIVKGHNEALYFWKELMEKGDLVSPFEVVHVDSHADLGLGYSSWCYILNTLLTYPVDKRPLHNTYIDCYKKESKEGIGDYLLFAIAYRWISKLVYCANPNGDKNDYILQTLKNFHEKYVWEEPVENIIQLVCNPIMDFPDNYASAKEVKQYLDRGTKEPEVPFTIIPNIKDVQYKGDFDFVVMAQSPNYTPQSADFIMRIFREYIYEY